jgi:ABC-type amino acid transport substrate-binding protein
MELETQEVRGMISREILFLLPCMLGRTLGLEIAGCVRKLREVDAARFILFFVALWAIPSMGVDADMQYVFNAPESALDFRYIYHWEILRTALDRTTPKYGPYKLTPAPLMTEKRQTYELENATGSITVMYLGTTRELERNLEPVRIPVDKNLGGYNVFLIRKADEHRFEGLRTLDDLRKFSYGLGLGWEDVAIMQSNNFRVVTGSSYDGLFEMLINRRFDIFLRAAVEVLGEYDERRSSMPDLAIEQNVILYYPLPMYFWFSKTIVGERLTQRAREGMLAMIEDGTYDRIFWKYQGAKVARLKLRDRRIFRISNPNLVPETPFWDARLWFDPTKD